jgi:glycosyltransferase involved in cell wall biosynthesis
MSETRCSVAAVIPALNEAAAIGPVIAGLKSQAAVIVVDDGSTDRTAEIARDAGAIVVQHPRNRGYDAALASGLQRAADARFEFAVTLDADGQHNPGLLGLFVDALEGGADLVVGARDRHQRVSEAAFAWVGRRVWGIEDPLCGMKGYRLASFTNAGRFDRYKSIGTSFALQAARSRFQIVQIPIKTRPRNGTPRFGSGLRPNLVIFKSLLLGLSITTAIKK